MHPDSGWWDHRDWRLVSFRRAMGFEAAQGTYRPPFTLTYGHRPCVRFEAVAVPYWSIVLLTAILPAVALVRAARRAKALAAENAEHAPKAKRRARRLWAGAVGVIAILIAIRAGLHAIGQPQYPLHFAIRNGDFPVAVHLLAEGADVNATDHQGRTPLHWAAIRGRHFVEIVTAKDPDVNDGDEAGHTPLHMAATCRVPPPVEALLNAGADVKARDHRGRTPLHAAAGSATPAVIQVLLQAGAAARAKTHDGRTPLHEAVGRHYWIDTKPKDVLETLLKAGADITAATDAGWTPLHFAAYVCNREVAELLLKRGAQINATDAEGRTPLDIARHPPCSNDARCPDHPWSPEIPKRRRAMADLLTRHGGHTGEKGPQKSVPGLDSPGGNAYK